jgi:hypothetical protein
MIYAISLCPQAPHPTLFRLWDQNIAPPHAGQLIAAGGLQLENPQYGQRSHVQNLSIPQVVRTITATPQTGQSLRHGTRGRR